MKQRFKARTDFITDQQANSYGMELFRLLKRLKRDAITPDDVVKDAKNPKRAYHDYFEWDDKVCGTEWRKRQARLMVYSIEEVTFSKTGKPLSVRSFLNVNIDGQYQYMPQKIVFEHVTLSKQVVDKALREIKGWTGRYETYSELSGLCSGIGIVVDSWKKTNPA